jgi:hypothetical protein
MGLHAIRVDGPPTDHVPVSAEVGASGGHGVNRSRHVNAADYYAGATAVCLIAMVGVFFGVLTEGSLLLLLVWFFVRTVWALGHEHEGKTARFEGGQGVLTLSGVTPADVEQLRRMLNSMYTRDHLLHEDKPEYPEDADDA